MFRVKALTVATVCTLGLTSGFLAGCASDEPDTPVDQPVGVTVDAPRVTVTSAGQGEKRVVRYQDIGEKQSVTAQVTEGFSQDLLRADAVAGFQPRDIKTRTTTLPVDGKTEQATEDENQAEATRNVFFTAHQPSATGDDAADISSADGFQAGWRATDDGAMSSLRLAAPQEADDTARAATEKAITKLTSLPVIFPTEPIGEGATWTVETRVAGESTQLQTMTFTLTKLDGDKATVGVDVEQRPSLGALSFGAEAAGTDLENKELEVKETSSNSSGSLDVDLHQPLPVGGGVDVDTKVVYGTDESPLRVVQSTVTGVKFSAPNASS